MEQRAPQPRSALISSWRSPCWWKAASRDRVDRILVVDVDEAVQLATRAWRAIGSSREQARAILAAQASRAARLAAADDVLLNAGTVTELRQAVDRLHERLSAPGRRPGARSRDLT